MFDPRSVIQAYQLGYIACWYGLEYQPGYRCQEHFIPYEIGSKRRRHFSNGYNDAFEDREAGRPQVIHPDVIGKK